MKGAEIASTGCIQTASPSSNGPRLRPWGPVNATLKRRDSKFAEASKNESERVDENAGGGNDLAQQNCSVHASFLSLNPPVETFYQPLSKTDSRLPLSTQVF